MINKIDIFGLRNGSTKKVATIPCDNSFHNTSMMAKDELSVSVVTDKPLNLVVGDYITIGDTSYRMNRDAEFTQKSEVQHEYSIIFEHPIYTLLDKVLCNRITGSTKVVLTGKLRDFLELLVWNVNRSESNPLGVDTGWEIGLCPDTEYKNIVLDGISCRAALDELRKAFNVEYYASNKTINFVSHIENETGLTFTQGRGKGLYSLEQKNVDSSDVVTRLFPKGGTENVIPGEGDEDGRLVLPEKYIEDFSETSKVVERVVVFDGIHPTFQGKVGALSGENNKSFICNEIDFDIKEFAVGSDARVNFLTGDLLGKAFEFSWDNSKKKITLIGQVDELALIDPSTQSRPVIPDANKYLRGGELFTLTGLRMSGTYKENAISTLREKGREWLKYHCRKRVKYNLDVDYRMLRGKRTLSVGDLVTIKDKNRGINALIRIVSVERNLRTGKLSCVVSNYLDEKWEKRIEGQIASVQTAISGGGYSSGNVDIIEKNDAREFTDSRILSSLRTIKEIIERSLSRQGDDTAEGLITFLKGLTSAERARLLKGFEAGVFNQGLSGALIDEQGDAELRNLIVRLKAVVSVLEVKGNTKTDSLSATNDITGKHVTATNDVTGKRVTASEKVSAPLVQGTQVKGTAVEATENVSGKNVLAQEGIAGKNVTATRKVKGADVEATETVKGKNVQAQEAVSGKRAELSERVTTLNLLVRALAEMHNLTVSDTARLLKGIIRESLSSPEFVSGFAGNGFKLYKDAVTGDWNMEIDNIVVRKLFNVFEIRVQRITHQGGMVIRSAAGGKITKVADMGSYWKCEHDGLDDFVANDQVICQAFKFIGEGGKIKRYWRLATEAGKGYVCLSKSDCEQSSSVPEKDDEIALLGNRTNKARQSAQIDCVIGNDAPYRDTYDGINSFSLAGKLISREGNLTGVVDPDFGSLNGYGLYTKNLFAKGQLRLTNGKTVETAISDGIKASKAHADAGITKVRTDFNIIEGQINAKVQEVTTKTQQAAAAAQTATEKASQAAGSATVAGQKATAAGNSAKAAKTSETNAGNILQEVTAKESNINVTAGQIATKVSEVNQKAVEVSTNAGNADKSAKAAKTSETNAGDSAATATQKAQAAASSAGTASAKAGEAATSATNAGKSATTAASEAGKAKNSADAAKASADAASAKLVTITEKESSINQTAGQISTQVTEVTKQAGIASQKAAAASGSAAAAQSEANKAKGSADSASASLQTISSKQTQINQTATEIEAKATRAERAAGKAEAAEASVRVKAGEVTVKAQEVVNKATEAGNSAQSAKNAAELSMAMSKGKMLYRDPTFKEGFNDTHKYNNKSGSQVQLERVRTGEGNPTTSTHMLRITTSGSDTSPGFGGFYFGSSTKANKVLVTRIIAKIPEGRIIEFASNAIGSNPVKKWLTPQVGTGKWEEYAFKLVCGTGGTFSTTNYFYIHGGDAPTPESPLVWYVAYATVFDVTDAEIDYIADAAAKYTTKTEYNAKIELLTNQINSKVSKTDFNALNQRVGSAESTLTQHASLIEARVTKTDFGTLTGRVTTAESKIAATENSIAATVSRVDGLTGRMSQAEQKITPDAIRLTVKSQTQEIADKAKTAAISTAASDATTKANNAKSAAISAAASDAATKANNAKAAAISAAASDAAGKYKTKTEFTSEINVLKGQINSKVSQTDFNGLGQRVSVAESKITPDAIKSTVKSQTQDIVNKSISIAVPKVEKKIDLRGDGFDQNKYYPVTLHSFRHDRRYRIKVVSPLHSSYGVPTWASHTAGFYLYAEWENHGSGWGAAGVDTKRVITQYNQRLTKSSDPVLGDIGQVYQVSNEYFYVRGGAAYDVIVEGPDNKIDIKLHQEEYVWQSTNGALSSRLPIKDSVVAPSITYTLDTVFTTEVKQLKDSIALRATKEEVNSLGATVSSHTAAINVLPTTIDNRITSQTNDGGIIKTKVESWFRMEGDKVYLGGKAVNISGATVFGSLASKTDAQGYANSAKAAAISTAASDATGKANNAKSAAISAAASDATTKANNAKAAAISAAASDATTKANNALNGAKGYTDQLKGTLKGMAYQDMVTLAKLDNTIIEGGFLKTSLIQAGSITAEKINVSSIRAAVLTAAAVNALDVEAKRIKAGSNPEAPGGFNSVIYENGYGHLGGGALRFDTAGIWTKHLYAESGNFLPTWRTYHLSRISSRVILDPTTSNILLDWTGNTPGLEVFYLSFKVYSGIPVMGHPTTASETIYYKDGGTYEITLLNTSNVTISLITNSVAGESRLKTFFGNTEISRIEIEPQRTLKLTFRCDDSTFLPKEPPLRPSDEYIYHGKLYVQNISEFTFHEEYSSSNKKIVSKSDKFIGLPLNVEAIGMVGYNGSKLRMIKNGSFRRYSVKKAKEGVYTVSISPGFNAADNYLVFVTSKAGNDDRPRYASVNWKSASGFNVVTGDDSSPNDSDFQFMVIDISNNTGWNNTV
ncbi:hypothetical protein ABLT32_02175 [Bacteroides pyogenes]|uniref:hypothetical protein n=1 Tax=Bacteroides pyogenes TaxID=310300 RepID=UPI004062FD6D